jgi:hypothetical protein
MASYSMRLGLPCSASIPSASRRVGESASRRVGVDQPALLSEEHLHFQSVKWVMSQVGHVNSKMTMDVYAQLEQRVERSHGIAFDELVSRARGRDKDADRDTLLIPG